MTHTDPALTLAEEYRIGLWVRALLDPRPIDKGASDPVKSISPPPKFVSPSHLTFPPPQSTSATPGRGRGRARSNSPSKKDSPTKKTASPRKRPNKAANVANANAASATLQTALTNAATAADADAHAHGHAHADGDTVRVEVDSAVEANGETETTHTNVKVELPAGSAEMPLPENTEEMLNTAKKMVEEARKIDGKGSKVTKRKADDLGEDKKDEHHVSQPSKRARVLEEELKKERVKTKALIGLSATLAIGYVSDHESAKMTMTLTLNRALIPYVL